MRSIVTLDATSTRFHACERFHRCDQVEVNGRYSHTADGTHVVYVNPVTMDGYAWSDYVRDTKKKMSDRDFPNNLVWLRSYLLPLLGSV